jgi:hypothetical protein
MKMEKRSPLKASPLRNPGQSLDERIDQILDEDLMPYLFVSVFCIVTAGLEWWRWYRELPPSPLVWTLFALGVTVYSVLKLFRHRKYLRNLKLGRDGERAVGQYLELLRENGYRVFHDLIGEGFNLDHVVVSEHGIFVIETKTYSKPAKGNRMITYDGRTLKVGTLDIGDKAINQVRAQATWLRGVLKESTGRDVKIRPIIVFPGWYVKATPEGKHSDVWVLNPKALPKFIGSVSKSLRRDDMMLTCFHISRYIRSGNANS